MFYQVNPPRWDIFDNILHVTFGTRMKPTLRRDPYSDSMLIYLPAVQYLPHKELLHQRPLKWELVGRVERQQVYYLEAGTLELRGGRLMR